MKYAFLLILTAMGLSGCSSMFTVNSDPLQADVYYQEPKSGEKKPLGKTPLSISASELRKVAGDEITSGQYFTVLVEKPGFQTESYSIPATRFGTMVSNLEVKMKKSDEEKEKAKERYKAQVVLDHIFLAQKLALSAQYERAQIELDGVLKEFPDFPRALSMRASIYFAQKNFSEAAKWYEQALKADPKMEDAVRMYAKVKDLQAGRTPASTLKSAPTSGAPAVAPAPAPKGGANP